MTFRCPGCGFLWTLSAGVRRAIRGPVRGEKPDRYFGQPARLCPDCELEN